MVLYVDFCTVKTVLKGHLRDKKKSELLAEVQYERTRKRLPLNTGDVLIEVQSICNFLWKD